MFLTLKEFFFQPTKKSIFLPSVSVVCSCIALCPVMFDVFFLKKMKKKTNCIQSDWDKRKVLLTHLFLVGEIENLVENLQTMWCNATPILESFFCTKKLLFSLNLVFFIFQFLILINFCFFFSLQVSWRRVPYIQNWYFKGFNGKWEYGGWCKGFFFPSCLYNHFF